MKTFAEMTVLIADDSPEIRELVSLYLEKEGFRTEFAENGRKACDRVAEGGIDLLILDVMMPVMDGFAACEEIRRTSVLPILFFTAKSEDRDKIRGLSAGGDDYLSKPFNPMELVARVKALLRRCFSYDSPAQEKPRVLVKEDLVIDLDAASVTQAGSEVSLTKTEFGILRLLAENRGVLFSIDKILEEIWQDVAVSRNTVMVYMRKIREKLNEDPKNPRYIKTVWGMGYKME